MKYIYVAKVYGLEVDRVLNRDIQVIENIRISNQRDRLERRCDIYFKQTIGTLEYDALLSGPYLYAEGDFPKSLNPEEGLIYLNYLNRLSQSLGTALWIIKDNSVLTEMGFLYIYNKHNKYVSSNSRTSYFLNSKGEINETRFSCTEIKDGINSYIGKFNEGNTADLEHHEVSKIITTQANRLLRFIYFLQTTRNQGFLPSRISMYCTLLETLLSTDNQEISHKISERTAKIIGKDLVEREEIFKFVKQAYAIRSANVHGDKLPKKFRELNNQIDISIKIDKLIRQLFRIIINDDDLLEMYINDNNEKLNIWFNKLILE